MEPGSLSTSDRLVASMSDSANDTCEKTTPEVAIHRSACSATSISLAMTSVSHNANIPMLVCQTWFHSATVADVNPDRDAGISVGISHIMRDQVHEFRNGTNGTTGTKFRKDLLKMWNPF